MSRSPVVIREAVPEDVPGLRQVMTTGPLTELDHSRPREAAAAVARTAADPDQRLLVAAQGTVVVGAVLLVRAPLTPLHTDAALHVLHLHVREDARRHGIGPALMEATVSWAEEKDIVDVLAAAPRRLSGRQPLPGPVWDWARWPWCGRRGRRAARQAPGGAAGGRPRGQPEPPQRRSGARPAPVPAPGAERLS